MDQSSSSSSGSSGSLVPPFDGSLPSRIGSYRVLRRLATGGTSDVLLGRAEGPHGFERTVVLKVLLQQYRDDKTFERMFALEAAAYARLSHPAIVKLFDFFSDAGQLVMVLEHVDGLPLHKLRALLKPLGLAFDDRAAMFVGWRIFCALAAAHSARDPQSSVFSPVIHRDVNPSNVLIPWDGHVKIADFGIAKIGGVDSDKTQAGFIKGTYGYMAPEQVRGEVVTVRADVYAGCLLLWELLTGRKAIVRGSMSDLDVLRAMAEPSFLSLAVLRPDLPPALLDAVSRGLQPDPRKRDILARELAHALRASLNLDEGRLRLVSALSAVRPTTMTEASAATAVPPPVFSFPEPSADATTPKAAVLLNEAASIAEKAGASTVRPSSPPLVATSRPMASLLSTLRLASMRTVPPRVTSSPLSRTPTPTPTPTTPVSSPPTPPPTPSAAAAPRHAAEAPARAPPPRPVAPTLAPAPRTQPPRPPLPASRPTLAPFGFAQVPARPRSVPPPPPQTFSRASFAPAPVLPPVTSVTAPAPVPAPAPALAPAPAPGGPSPFAFPTPPSSITWTPRPPPDAAFVPVRGRAGIAVVASILVLAGVAGVVWSRTRPRAYAPPAVDRAAATWTAPPTPSADRPPAPGLGAAVTASATASAVPEAPPLAPWTGTVTIGPAHGGHRVWIDKRLVGESPGTFSVACGGHVLQIGSLGTPMHVQVPCGRDLKMR